MEEYEMKKRKQRRRRIVQHRSTSSLPLDLISEILLRLPAKSVVRFRCVSKLWSSIITDPLFIKSFETRSSTLPSLLLSFQQGDKLYYSSIPQHQEITDEYYDVTIDHGHEKLHDFPYFSSTESVHGLICFQKSTTMIIWNPSIRQFLDLPNPGNTCKGVIAYLGYDSIEGKHKVVCVDNNFCNWCWVLTLGSAQKEWRKITTNHQHHSFKGSFGRCINGVIYYPACTFDSSTVIMSFDVRYEKLDMILLPADTKIERDGLIAYEGSLACVKDITHHDRSTLLILEDADKHKWLRKDFLAPFFYDDRSLRFLFQLRGMTPGGELVYSPNLFDESIYVLLYDLKIKRFRKVECEGMTDEFRLNKDIVKGHIYMFHTFLNYTESLKSL